MLVREHLCCTAAPTASDYKDAEIEVIILNLWLQRSDNVHRDVSTGVVLSNVACVIFMFLYPEVSSLN